MPFRARLPPLVALAIAPLFLAGCIPAPEAKSGASSAVAPQLFDSTDAADRAVKAALTSYLEISDSVYANGGAGADRLEAVVTPEQYASLSPGLQAFAESGQRLTGSSTFDSVHIQELDSARLQAQVCLDVTDVRTLDAGGTDVTPADRVTRIPFTLVFVSGGPTKPLILAGDVPWSGDDFCAR